MGTRRSRAEWESLVSELEASGQSVARFSARRGLKPETVQWWRWKVHRADAPGGNAVGSVRLMPVTMIESAATADVGNPALVEVSLGDITLRVAVGADPAYVASLVAALRAQC
jgi:hypothetical protein